MHDTLLLLLELALILAAAKVAGALSARVGQPAVFGELLAGLLLGPSLLGVLHPNAVLDVLAEIGVVVLMFVAGLETDLVQMRRVGRAALWSACGGVALPMAAGTWISLLFGFGLAESVFVGAVLTATSVSISAQTLMELGRLRSREGTTILGAAVIDDVLGIVVLSLVIAWNRGGSGGELALLGPRIVGFFAVATALGLWLLPRLLPRVARIPATQVVGAFALAVCFVYAWGAEAIGSVAAITGSYLAGVLFARTEYRERVGHTFETLGYAFLVPIFFLSIGLQAQAQGLAPILAYAGVVVGIAVAAKAVGCALGALVGGFGAVESVRVGVGMISRGEVALIAAAIGHEAGVLDDRLFAAMVVMALATTMVTPVLLKFAFAVGGAPPAEPRHVAPSPMEVEGERPAPRG